MGAARLLRGEILEEMSSDLEEAVGQRGCGRRDRRGVCNFHNFRTIQQGRRGRVAEVRSVDICPSRKG